MNLETLTQKKPVLLGLTQSILALLYITLLATFFQAVERSDFQAPDFLAAIMMLSLFVLSGTIMGLITLGMPAYLVLKGNWPKALKIIGFTLLFSLLVIAILVSIAFFVF